MFKPKEDRDDVTKINTEPPRTLVTACKQIVDCLVNHILVLEEKGFKTDSQQLVKPDSNKGFQTPNQQQEAPRSASQRLVACLRTLYLFAKIRPHLLVDHAITLQPYLSLKCQVNSFLSLSLSPEQRHIRLWSRTCGASLECSNKWNILDGIFFFWWVIYFYL